MYLQDELHYNQHFFWTREHLMAIWNWTWCVNRGGTWGIRTLQIYKQMSIWSVKDKFALQLRQTNKKFHILLSDGCNKVVKNAHQLGSTVIFCVSNYISVRIKQLDRYTGRLQLLEKARSITGRAISLQQTAPKDAQLEIHPASSAVSNIQRK